MLVLVIVLIIVWPCDCDTDEVKPDLGDPGAIPTTAFEDVIQTPYAVGEVVALLDGDRSGCLNDLPSGPFLDESVGLGNFTGGCGSKPAYAALFSRDRRARFLDPKWSSGFDTVTEPAVTPASNDAPVVVMLRLWKAVVEDEYGSAIDFAHFVAAISDDVAIVNDIFNGTRAGVEFDFAIDEIVQVSDNGKNAREPDLVALCADSLSGTPPTYKGVGLRPDRLDVLFLDAAAMGGISCDATYDGVPDGVLVVNWFKRLDGTIMAHELGHSLGLMGRVGHPVRPDSIYTGFDEQNVMWSYWAAAYPEERDHFTVGQIYRMNVADNSWMVMKESPTWQTACQGEHHKDDPCPHLRQELTYIP